MSLRRRGLRALVLGGLAALMAVAFGAASAWAEPSTYCVKATKVLTPKKHFTGGFNDKGRSFLAKEVKPPAGQTEGRVEFHFEIMLPLFLSIFGVEGCQYAGAGQRENQVAVADRACDVGDIFFRGPNHMGLGDIALPVGANGHEFFRWAGNEQHPGSENG